WLSLDRVARRVRSAGRYLKATNEIHRQGEMALLVAKSGVTKSGNRYDMKERDNSDARDSRTRSRGKLLRDCIGDGMAISL
ncbi:hypothetical protein, partial [Bradyrhizobium sp. 142]|uniref:hypothetical protein n=1 Tax=Bradyrhizobium sp. 142 TaxID=2782618 RepID=UPI001FF7BA37